MRYSLVIIFLCFIYALKAQPDLHVTNYFTTREGLSNNHISCMTSDTRGFLWLGTREGLNRFDGLFFKKYFFEKNNPRSLSHNNVFDIIEYKMGQLMIATGNGISILNTLTGQFENEKIKFAPLRAGSGAVVSSLYKDKQGNIWINHSGELDVLDSSLNYRFRLSDIEWAKSLKGITVYFENWYCDRQNRLWLASDTSGINIIDFANKKVYNQNNNPLQIPYLGYTYIRAILPDEENNTLWVAPWGLGLIKYDLKNGKFQGQYFTMPENTEASTINSIVKLKNGNLLITVNGQGFDVNPQTLFSKPVTFSFPKSADVNINSICMFSTPDLQYWVGTVAGLFQISRKNSQKEINLVMPGKARNASECYDLTLSSSGKLYSAYANKLLIEVDKNRNSFRHYLIPGDKNNIIIEVSEDKNNRLWVGTTQGIWLFDTTTKSFYRPDFLPPVLLNIYISVLFCDSGGDTWIGTREPFNLYRYQASSNTCEKVDNKIMREFASVGESGRISTIVEDRKGFLWMVSDLGGGIIGYEKKSESWQLYPSGIRNYNFMAKKGLLYVYADNKNYLWLCSVFGDGLIRYDYKKDSIVQFTREDGLLSDNIYLSPDNSGNLLLATEYGITKFNLSNLQSQTNNIFNRIIYSPGQRSLFDPLTNSLVMGLPQRLLFVPVDSSAVNTDSPNPLIDKITVNSKQQYFEPGDETLTLASQQKNISIDFTAIRFTNADKIRFAYQLSDVDNDWKYTETNRTAQYSILAPGKYTFRVKAANESGVWNQAYASFTFNIAVPWWQTMWFRVLASITIAGLIFYFVRKRIKSIRREAGLKQKIAETEMMALRAQMNPHFIFNCINSIDALIQSNDKYNATVYLNKFARLIRNILDSSTQNAVPVSKDLETLKLYIELEQFRNENKFTAVIKVDDIVMQDDYKVPPLIVQPYVENAILHGLRNRRDNNGKLLISVIRLNSHLEYTIEDNGVGRGTANDESKKQRKSYGMQMSGDRVKIFNKEENASVVITDLTSNGEAAGTKVRVRLNVQL